MNTFGLFYISDYTFNLRWHTNYNYPKEARDIIVTFLKIHNLVLNVLGYIQKTSQVSGCVRMVTGILICAVTLAIGERDAQEGVIIQHWYDEALLTGIAQIARGALEAFIPYGRVINATLDVLATFYNLSQNLSNASTCMCCHFTTHAPHPEPDYPAPFWLLHLV